METKDMVPRLRFGNFHQNWLKSSLSEEASFINGKGHEKNIDPDGDYIVVNSKYISTQGKVLKLSNKQFSPLNEDDVVMVMSDVPNGRALARCYYITKSNVYTLNQRICCLRSQEIDSKFLYYYLDRNKYFLMFDSGVGQTNLRKDDVLNCPIIKPRSIIEQQKIASFLSSVDEKISQLEKKKTLLETYKRGIMQKIFSQQLRFKDENGQEFPEWRNKKIGSLTKVFDGTHATPKYVEKGIPFYSVESVTNNDFINTKFISEEVYIKENKRVKLERDDILMTRIGSVGIVKHIDWDVNASFYVSLALLKKSKEFYSPFLCFYIQSSFFQKELWKRMLHVAFPKKINLGDIGKCFVNLPCDAEQQKIASFLSSIDNKIEITSTQLEKTREFKKGLLQQMFV